MIAGLALRAITVLAIVSTAWPAIAGEIPGERAKLIFDRDWIAGSTTAMAITGDARLTPSSIMFDERVFFRLRYLSEVAPPLAEREYPYIRQFSLFEFLSPPSDAILNGNHLCGLTEARDRMKVPRYLAVGLTSGEKSDLVLIVFASDAPPPDVVHVPSEEFCGSYHYFYDDHPGSTPQNKPSK